MPTIIILKYDATKCNKNIEATLNSGNGEDIERNH